MLNSKWNTGYAAVLATVLLSACAGSPTTESTGEYLDDAAITTKVKTAFLRDKDVKSTDIKVQTYKGTVQLSGFTGSRAEINHAVEVARHVSGVKSVHNDIHVKPNAERNRAEPPSDSANEGNMGSQSTAPYTPDSMTENASTGR